MHITLPNRQTFVKGLFAKLALDAADAPFQFAKMAKNQDQNRIREARKRAGKTLEDLADATGLSPGYISRMESAARNVSTKNLRKIAEALGTTADRLISEDEPEPVAHEMPVRGEVRAGAWLEIDGDPAELETIPALPDPRFAGAPQYALRGVGTSMNKVAPPGQYVIVASWPELGVELRDGDLVVVKRSRAMTYEVTLKRARKGEKGEWQLWPESTDPRYQEPVILGDGDRDVEVSVIAKVVGRYEPL